MIDEISSIFWGLSLAFNIILVLVGLPLCLLICCCCRKHQGAIEKDLKTLARNHNLLQNAQEEEEVEEQPVPKRRKVTVKTISDKPHQQQKPVVPNVLESEPDLSVPNLQDYELEE